jgi:hypothetical protein
MVCSVSRRRSDEMRHWIDLSFGAERFLEVGQSSSEHEQRIAYLFLANLIPVWCLKRADAVLANLDCILQCVDVFDTHGDHIGNVRLFPNSTVLMQRTEYAWISSPDGPNENVNQLKALAVKLLYSKKS